MKQSTQSAAQDAASSYQVPLANVSFPLVTRERFSELTGLTAQTVYSMCDRGYIPTIHLGGRRVFVNLEALRLIALKAAEAAIQ